jgi:hypothetical protein
MGRLAERLRGFDAVVLRQERTRFRRALVERLPDLADRRPLQEAQLLLEEDPNSRRPSIARCATPSPPAPARWWWRRTRAR